MDKEEILRKSREAKEDEGEEYLENKGRSFGVIGFCVVFIAIMFFNISTHQNNFVPYSMFFAYMAAEAYGKYKIKKQKAYMVTIGCGSLSSILFFICHVLDVLGIGQ